MRTILVIFVSVLLSVALAAFFLKPAANGPVETTSRFRHVFESKTLRCGYVVFPPYLIKDPASGSFSGPAYDVVMAVAKTLNLTVQWTEEIPVGGERASLDKGGVDAICAITGPYDGNLMPLVAYSVPYMRIENGIYVRADNPRFQNTSYKLADLDTPDVRFAGIESDPSTIFPQMLMPKATISILPALSEPSQLFMDVKSGKADATMLEPAPSALAMDANPGVFKRLTFTDQLPTYFATMVFPKQESELKETFDTAIDFLLVNGEIDSILDKYDPNAEMFIRVTP